MHPFRFADADDDRRSSAEEASFFAADNFCVAGSGGGLPFLSGSFLRMGRWLLDGRVSSAEVSEGTADFVSRGKDATASFFWMGGAESLFLVGAEGG